MKKHILFLAIIGTLLCVSTTYAQKQKVLNYPKYDKRKVHFGFAFMLNYQDFSVNHFGNAQIGDTLLNVTATATPGFSFNIVSDFALGEYTNIRFLPGLSLCSRQLNFTYYSYFKGANYTETKNVESTLLMFPVLVKYKSRRLNNFRAYALAGGEYDYDLLSARGLKKSAATDIVRLKPHQYSTTLGFGFDFYTNYFKFSPEFRYGIGLNDIQIHDGNIYSNALNGLRGKYWMVSVYFE
ncbi:MAG: porin family protein [Bacteroidia bacterium]